MSCPVDEETNNGDSQEQQQRVWRRLQEFHAARTESFSSHHSTASSVSQCERSWPSYDRVAAHVSSADYNHTLTCPMDMLPASQNDGKILCPHAAVCCVRLELFPCPDRQRPYTGLLTPGTTVEHGLLRMSSAMKPPGELKSSFARAVLMASGDKLRKSRLFPCAALKFFRKDTPSGNLLLGGSKIGQRETDYFAHCQCTSMTEQMPRLVKPFVKKFWKYSQYPLSLGLSDFCHTTADGEPVGTTNDWNFPFALILQPSCNLQALTGQNELFAGDADSAFDHFLDSVLALPAQTVLFDVFACAAPHDVPDPSKLQRIGRITSTSAMLPSSPDDGIFFKHQKKEDDYQLRPGWSEALKASVSIDNGRTTGTVGQLAGWKLFEQQLAKERYVDYEDVMTQG